MFGPFLSPFAQSVDQIVISKRKNASHYEQCKRILCLLHRLKCRGNCWELDVKKKGQRVEMHRLAA